MSDQSGGLVDALAEVILTSYLTGPYNQAKDFPLVRDDLDDDGPFVEYAQRYASAVLDSGLVSPVAWTERTP